MPVSPSLRDQQIAALKPLEAPRAMLLDMVVTYLAVHHRCLDLLQDGLAVLQR